MRKTIMPSMVFNNNHRKHAAREHVKLLRSLIHILFAFPPTELTYIHFLPVSTYWLYFLGKLFNVFVPIFTHL